MEGLVFLSGGGGGWVQIITNAYGSVNQRVACGESITLHKFCFVGSLTMIQPFLNLVKPVAECLNLL